MPFKIIRNDITAVKADIIVNSANPNPVYSSGTDAAIYQAAGIKELLTERRKIGKLKVGEAAITPAFRLNAKYIIHTVGPEWQAKKYGQTKKLRLCYENCLRLAKEYKCESIAFPLISTGTYGFPKKDAIKIALSVISDFLSEEDMMIYLVVFDKESFTLSEKLFKDVETYIDDHYVDEKSLNRIRLESQPLPMMTSVPVPSALPYTLLDSELEYDSDDFEDSCQKIRSLSKGQKAGISSERTLDDVLSQLEENFQQRLFRLIDERKLTDVQVYKKANLDRKLFSKIRCNSDYRPKKITIVALAIALELNLDETKDLLARAELALSPGSKFDLIVSFFIERKVYDVYTINLALFQHDQPLLGE